MNQNFNMATKQQIVKEKFRLDLSNEDVSEAIEILFQKKFFKNLKKTEKEELYNLMVGSHSWHYFFKEVYGREQPIVDCDDEQLNLCSDFDLLYYFESIEQIKRKPYLIGHLRCLAINVLIKVWQKGYEKYSAARVENALEKLLTEDNCQFLILAHKKIKKQNT